ncbi:MAG: hypothetical protein BroJett007_35720 [Chloroflexota bacterium]|nr:MAG: hypothetical protein BroJett007_35720 [Chloroflexota bacterium]
MVYALAGKRGKSPHNNMEDSMAEFKIYRVVKVEAPPAEPATGRYSTKKRKLRIIDAHGAVLELVLHGADDRALLVRTKEVPR